MNQTPLSERLRVVLAGPRNAGKSSLMNALFQREVSLVSPVPGTTTDPVTRAFEMPGIGAVAFTDTPGIDDEGNLGIQRVRLAKKRAAEADIKVFVTPSYTAPGEAEKVFFEEWFNSSLRTSERAVPVILVLSYGDKHSHPAKAEWAERYGALRVESPSGRGIDSFVKALAAARPRQEAGLLDGLVNEGDTLLMVTPIDLAAPAGRMIQPQVQAIRNTLDRDACVVVVKERELRNALDNLKTPPKLVITDSQAFSKVAADISEDQLLTSFSILFARKKGDILQFLDGLAAASKLPSAPRVLVIESCSHHRQADDIGTVKIPRLFRQLIRDDARFEFQRCLPKETEISNFDLIIHCGACRLTRTAMSERLRYFHQAGVPITNYGLFLALVNGLMPRALEPFGDVMEKWHSLFGH